MMDLAIVMLSFQRILGDSSCFVAIGDSTNDYRGGVTWMIPEVAV